MADRPLALVTGASAGIGEAYARELARRGFDLLVVARRANRLDSLVHSLRSEHGVHAEAIVADLSDGEGIRFVEQAIAATDRLELLVNNAGFAGYMPFLDLDPETAEALIGVHVLATTRLTRAALPRMVERGSGAVVNVASMLAFAASIPPNPLPSRATYGGAKAYIVAFTRNLAHELEGTGVKVQALCPGVVRTEFHEVAGMDVSRTNMPRMEADDVARASLASLELGEVVCSPALGDATLLEQLADAERTLFRSGTGGAPAARYRA
jgi:short-subunit dehydrogenase